MKAIYHIRLLSSSVAESMSKQSPINAIELREYPTHDKNKQDMDRGETGRTVVATGRPECYILS